MQDTGPIKYVTVGSQTWADFGTGFTKIDAPGANDPKQDPFSIESLWQNVLGEQGHFEPAGDETVNGRAATHYALSASRLARQRKSRGAGSEAWTADVWVAKDGGYLVRAVWGGDVTLAGAAKGTTQFIYDVTDADCTCPVESPL